ncbi:hypothetical protein [Mesorhizobium sp. M1005]|uniref:hypothetical protein n=1 Tax=unclassified Mesorhizobium TaxID=325217 RepID=UPI003338FCBF
MEIIPSDHPNILIGIRRIEHGDQTALFSSEVAALGRAVAKVRRQSGAARIIARTLLGQMGFPPTPIVKTRSGVPTWPAGIVGSLAHHDTAALNWLRPPKQKDSKNDLSRGFAVGWLSERIYRSKWPS